MECPRPVSLQKRGVVDMAANDDMDQQSFPLSHNIDSVRFRQPQPGAQFLFS